MTPDEAAGFYVEDEDPAPLLAAYDAARWTAQDCPDDAPDGSCWHCGAGRRERHRDDCATRQDSRTWTQDELDEVMSRARERSARLRRIAGEA
jgi:hypothetical protein